MTAGLTSQFGCTQVRKVAGAWLDGELPEKIKALVIGHLRICKECLGLAEDLARVKRAVRASVRSEAVPAFLSQRIQGLMRSARKV
jgi:predicted anti-sigma-YlaC factor YlaD